jgi:hypothetical protein
MFLKFTATAGHYMGDQRTRGSVSYHNIPLSSQKENTAFFLIGEKLQVMLS